MQRVFPGSSLGCQPELGRDRQPGGQGQLLAVARTSHSLTCGGLTCVDLTRCGASIDPPPMLLAGLAMDEDQAEHRGEQQDRREQTDAALSDKRPGDQVGDSDSQRDAPDDQQPASATHLRSPPGQVRPGGDVQDGHAANGFAGALTLGVAETGWTVRPVMRPPGSRSNTEMHTRRPCTRPGSCTTRPVRTVPPTSTTAASGAC